MDCIWRQPFIFLSFVYIFTAYQSEVITHCCLTITSKGHCPISGERRGEALTAPHILAYRYHVFVSALANNQPLTFINNELSERWI